MAKKAAEKGYEEAMKRTEREYTSEFNGIKFKVYLEESPTTKAKTGVIENAHPE